MFCCAWLGLLMARVLKGPQLGSLSTEQMPGTGKARAERHRQTPRWGRPFPGRWLQILTSAQPAFRVRLLLEEGNRWSTDPRGAVVWNPGASVQLGTRAQAASTWSTQVSLSGAVFGLILSSVCAQPPRAIGAAWKKNNLPETHFQAEYCMACGRQGAPTSPS